MNSERELAERLAAHGCDTGLSRNGRLVRFDDRACGAAYPFICVCTLGD